MKPYVRWWWLSGPFLRADITKQLNWVNQQGFGGVELAWIYPGWLEEEEDNTRLEFLGPDWQNLVAFTKSEADALGLGCDLTFGSCWPFGGSWVTPAEASQTFDGLSEQRIGCTWEQPISGSASVVNHLSSAALEEYARPLFAALSSALGGNKSALFCDSLELDTEGMWSEQLWQSFEERFGYDLHPFVDNLDSKANREVRYDYRKLISDTIRREFYEKFTAICHEHGAVSRVQCHGAPTDLLQAYASIDIPESEALLFLPSFSRIAASAAAWAGKPIVSAETFTCIYGFPGRDDGAEKYWKREQPGDLKLLADALFANGVNRIVWHGMPFQPTGKQVEFYASVHVGPDSPLAPHFLKLNAYLAAVSTMLNLGKPFGGIGVYLPFEDALMRGHLPPKGRTPGANFCWEMRHAAPSAELAGHQPLWISYGFLKEATVENGLVCSRELKLQALYIDAQWIDADSIAELARLGTAGATIICQRPSQEPGRKKTASYASNLKRILASGSTLMAIHPLVCGEDLPPYWARVIDDDLLIFLAHPKAGQITYPMPYAFAGAMGKAERNLHVNWQGREVSVDLEFDPGQALGLLVSSDGAVEIKKLQLID